MTGLEFQLQNGDQMDILKANIPKYIMRPKLDQGTGEHIDNVFAGTRESYYIPFIKKNVDEIIANSAHSDKFAIKYIVKFGHRR